MAYDVGRILNRGVPFVVENAEIMGHVKVSPKRAAVVQKSMRAAVRTVAGPAGSRDAKTLTDKEIAQIRDPLLRELVRSAAIASEWYGATGGPRRGGSNVYDGDGRSSGRVPDPDGSIYQRGGNRGPYLDGSGEGSPHFDEGSGERGDNSASYWDVDGNGGSARYWDVDGGGSGSSTLF